MFNPIRALSSRLLVYVSVCALLLPGLNVAQAQSGGQGLPAVLQELTPVTLPGQSATLLPDGRWLLLGGGSPASATGEIVGGSGRSSLHSQMLQVRSGHSATLLPDGHVLIFGGNDALGNVLASAERYDIAAGRFEPLTDLGLIPRIGHSATVLVDGRLLFAGGVNQLGQLIHEAEIYDPVTQHLERFNPRMEMARMHHIASLLPDANVLLWGGAGLQGEPLANGELYEFVRQRFQRLESAELEALNRTPALGQTPTISTTAPLADTWQAQVDQPLMVHFAQRMRVESLNDKTVTLVGPQGPVSARIIPVEQGTLLFINPLEDLVPNSPYTLFIAGAVDMHEQALPFTAIGFGTAVLVDEQRPHEFRKLAGRGGLAEGSAIPATTEKLAKAAALPTADPAQWQPKPGNLAGDWRAGLSESPLQKLPALLATGGLTALSGQVLALDGQGLKNVTLTIGARSTQTDEIGRFLLMLPNVATGVHVLSIEGRTAERASASYGFYQTRVDITAGRTSRLGYTIWLTAQDSAGDASLPSPTAQEVRVSSPNIPGLELVIPPGTVIRGRDGKIVTRINITPIPTDRTPFPIPQLDVPVYFTTQPGGAKLTTIKGGSAQGARLIYPNFGKVAPGTRIDFWNYDTQAKGWYVYGQGTVSTDGKQIVPDATVAIYEFTGAMVASPSSAPSNGPPPDGCNSGDGCNRDPNQPSAPSGCEGDPVDCATGLFLRQSTDLYVDDVVPLMVTRSYRPRDSISRAFGIGANLGYDYFMVGTTNLYTWQDLVLPNGTRIHFVRTSPGTGFVDAVYEHKASASVYHGAILRYRDTEESCAWELLRKDGTRMCFPDSEGYTDSRGSAVRSWTDRYGNHLQFERSLDNLVKVVSPGGRSLQFSYDAKRRITAASDNAGRTVRYEYDEAGRLIKFTDAVGQSERYTYDANHNMLTVVDKRGNTMVSNVYDGNNRVISQTYADGTNNQFAYTLAASGTISQTVVVDERGNVKKLSFNEAGGLLSVTRAPGLPEEQNSTIMRDPVTGLILSQTDALGRKTAYIYDGRGNMLTRTALAGTAEAVMSTTTYTNDFSSLASVTDALGRTWSMQYDAQGNLAETVDPNGSRITRSYNGAGQLIQTTDSLGNTTQFAYEGYDLLSVSDPLGRTTRLYTDLVGRLVNVTTTLGNRKQTAFDVLNRVATGIDPLGGTSSFGYDPNGNRTVFTDPKGSAHRFTYDVRNRVASDTDPLSTEEKYAYDGKGNLTQKIDRKGQITRYVYDALDRLKMVTYADGSTLALAYDKANRVTTMSDSVSGMLSFTYDMLDRLTRADSPKGSVSYTYYANGLRKTMTAPGMPTLAYTYDGGNRLTQIEQAAGVMNSQVPQHITFTYDAANRRTGVRYPNGIVRNNTYDAAGQLIGITYYKPDAALLGDLTYGYDSDGQRTGVDGSFARTGLPETAMPIDVNAAHAATRFGAQEFSYDQNGNMTSDGRQTYVWNARDQLVQIKGIDGTEVARFSYDALGRRLSKTVRGISQGYVYDGANIVQELNGLTGNNSSAENVKAGYINGGIDEVFAQVAGGKVTTYLSDAQNSTIRLTDENGGKLVDYTYDPYGNTTADAAVDNPFQYTGRENDGTGLYYYRARYYAPGVAKFISRDPIRLSGGGNFYAYVKGDPINFIDPSGELGVAGWATAGIGAYAAYKIYHDYKDAKAFACKMRRAQNNVDRYNGLLDKMMTPTGLSQFENEMLEYLSAQIPRDRQSIAISGIRQYSNIISPTFSMRSIASGGVGVSNGMKQEAATAAGGVCGCED